MKSKIMDKVRKLFISKCDPAGSYTGTPTDGSQKPEQDADDL